MRGTAPYGKKGQANDFEWRLDRATDTMPSGFRRLTTSKHPIASVFFYSRDVRLPATGWKIHVSCGLRDAVALFDEVVPYLFDNDVSFKLAASLDAIRALNSGAGGLSQVGKVLTIYPPDDDSFRRHAIWIDRRWKPNRFPIIRSDYRISREGAIFFRRGRFVHESSPADGAKDVRLESSNSLPTPLPDMSMPRHERAIVVGKTSYTRIQTVRSSAKGTVEIGVSPTFDAVFLKLSHMGADEDVLGFDSSDRLRREINLLTEARAAGVACPKILDRSDVAVALEDIRGSHVGQGHEQPVSMLCAIISQILRLHDAGVVHRDLKPDNIILGDQGAYLIDFEHACRTDEKFAPACSSGVYTAPEASCGSPSLMQDVYSIGVIGVEVLSGTKLSARNELDKALSTVLRSKGARFYDVLRAASSLHPSDRCRLSDLNSVFAG